MVLTYETFMCIYESQAYRAGNQLWRMYVTVGRLDGGTMGSWDMKAVSGTVGDFDLGFAPLRMTPAGLRGLIL